MGEKFSVNAATGTGSFTAPIFTSPGRSDFYPDLSLNYDSGSGNGPFGLGWNLATPSVTRKTDKGLPRYQDADESDVFILSDAEDLVPFLNKVGPEWQREVAPQAAFGQQWSVYRYRPRIEGLFARIEHWRAQDGTESHWRVTSRENITNLYGLTGGARIADPADRSRIFSWLLERTYDDKGNLIVYEYKGEDDAGIERAQPHEKNRLSAPSFAQRYLKRIKYGNKEPHRPGPTPFEITFNNSAADWLFEVAFDYGEGHYEELPVDAGAHQFVRASLDADPNLQWPVRQDPFSTYRAGFEIRTYRLCRRVLMFHHFPDELGTPNYIVRSTDFEYRETPIASFIESITQSGYVRQQNDAYLKRSLPPLDFQYSEARIDDRVHTIDSGSVGNLPYGVDGAKYQWLDLDGEGLSGIITEQAGAWFYKRNLSPINQVPDNGSERLAPLFDSPELVASKPTLDLAGGNAQFMDLAGDGKLDLVTLEGPAPGFYERTDDAGWETFRPFTSWPNVNKRDPNLRFIDLDGDGHADILISEDQVFRWHPSLAEDGFGPSQFVHQSDDEERGPRLVFADATQSIFLADFSGDGLTDIVRIRNGEVCYWPNLGYGRFGPKVTMSNSPWFDLPDQFDQRRILLADIDGSGVTDIIYLRGDGVHLYFNQSGNGWSESTGLSQFPHLDNLTSVTAVDLLGNGTACLVWSSPLPGDTDQPMRYIDLMGGQKPHLLISTKNNMGAESHLYYAPSTQFYLADKVSGQPWITRLPFPVHVVERVETYDRISRNRYVTRYTYHHGYFDGFEREFRGFGLVEQVDTEELAVHMTGDQFPSATNIDEASHVPPILSKTWFHTGAGLDGSRISRQFEDEYYQESDENKGLPGLTVEQAHSMLLDDTILPDTIRLTTEARAPHALSIDEEREASRSLKGSILRLEIYALDGTEEEDRPYSVSERSYTIEMLQPSAQNRYGVFFTHERETVNFHYERKLFDVGGHKLADPRVSHTMTLTVDEFGNVLQSVAIGYGRRYDDPDPMLTVADRQKQKHTVVTYTENGYTDAVREKNSYRLPLLCETRVYELLKVTPDANQPRVTNLFRFAEIVGKAQAAGDGQHDIPYEDMEAAGARSDAPHRRMIEHVRMLYRRDDLTGALPLGRIQSLALLFESYRLALTPGLLSSVYKRKLDGVEEELLLDPVLVLRHAGGYIRSKDYQDLGLFPGDGDDDNWWIPSGRLFYSPGGDDKPPEELAYARKHFFLTRRLQNPFEQTTTVTYDPYDLLVQETHDPVGNRFTAGERNPVNDLVAQGNDYRVLQPGLVMEPNRNRSAVVFDALGMVVGVAVMGKPEQNLGDSLEGFEPELEDAEAAAHLEHPFTDPHTILRRATRRHVYDLFNYWRTRDDAQPQPSVAYTLARETHDADLTPDRQTKLRHSFSYSDGLGREIQKKVQAEPGPVVERGPEINPRWAGNGWTIFNNKGKPVRLYEPFFSDTHRFEFAKAVGVSPVIFYDPAERAVATLHPNHSYEKIVFDPWQESTWDVNDTVLQADPKSDPDVGDFFRRLPEAEYLPTWHEQRRNGALGRREQEAAAKTAAHANTPTVNYLDPLARPFLTVTHNRFVLNDAVREEKYSTRVSLDVEGNERAISDARGRVVMRYDYDMLGNRIHQASMESGERWMLNDVAGKSIYGWDSRGHAIRTVYDAARRPTEVFVREGDGPERLAERTTYGETQPEPEASNLRGQVFQVFDCAGVITRASYDFKGNLLRSDRQLAVEYKNSPDWSGEVALEELVYVSRTSYDAFNRPVALTAPDNSVTRPIYNEANLLQRVEADLRGSEEVTTFVGNIDYNARGQRTLIEYGNGVQTQYSYDPQTFRLIRLFATRGNAFPDDCPNPHAPPCGVQNLSYTYDALGNITHIRDDAQQTIYFRNRQVDPSADYTYDAIYRLIAASGREHLGQVAGDGSAAAPTPASPTDAPRVGLLHPDDGNAMGNYREQYVYDEAGNILEMIHRGSDSAHPGWKRSYGYNEPSLLEPYQTSNRLTSTRIGHDQPQTYTYDAHGNMTTMPHLPLMRWDYQDELQATSQQVVNNGGTPEITYYVYDANGQRVRKVTERQASADGHNPGRKTESIYLNNFEFYREYTDDGNTVTVERETLHIMDDEKRIALVETRTRGDADSPPQLIRYQFGNHLGSACMEMDEQAKIISYEEYYPYGSTSYQATRSQTQTPKRYRYSGKERDEENGLYYHGARYYAPWVGRWINCDPAGFADGLNLYEYAENNPINFFDPTGKQPYPGEYRAQGFVQTVNQMVRDSPTASFMVDHPVLTITGAMVAAVAVVAAIEAAPVVAAWVAANPGTATAIGSVGVGVVDPHPPGASPLDIPGPLDDVGRAGKAVVKEGAEKIGQVLERKVLPQVEKKVLPQVGEKVAPQVEKKIVPQAQKKIAQAEKKVAQEAATSAGPLKFGENDLVYGPSAGGALRDLQKQAGGKLLNDLEKTNVGQSFVEFSLDTLNKAASSGRKVHFDLTHVKALEDVLAGKGELAKTVTGQELQHIAKNWEKFKGIVTFYREGKVVTPPWVK